MTIEEIKNQITAKFVADTNVQRLYGLDPTKTFDEQFSKVGIESILFYIMAYASWLLQNLFALHKTETDAMLLQRKTHTIRWYRQKVLDFRFGKSLLPDSDQYPEGMTDEEIAAAKVVKYCAVIDTKGKLIIKVAGGSDMLREPITQEQYAALSTYLSEIKDAGVNVELINREPDDFKVQITIVYNPLVLNNEGGRLDGTDDSPVQNTIRKHIANLPFNGEYTNMALVDDLQKVDGVVIPELKISYTKYAAYPFTPVQERVIPDAGYMKIDDENMLLTFIPYKTNESV